MIIKTFLGGGHRHSLKANAPTPLGRQSCRTLRRRISAEACDSADIRFATSLVREFRAALSMGAGPCDQIRRMLNPEATSVAEGRSISSARVPPFRVILLNALYPTKEYTVRAGPSTAYSNLHITAKTSRASPDHLLYQRGIPRQCLHSCHSGRKRSLRQRHSYR